MNDHSAREHAALLAGCPAAHLTVREHAALAFAAALLATPQSPIYTALPDGPRRLAVFAVTLADELLVALTQPR